MNLADVMQELADQLDTIAGLRVYAYPPASVQPPAAVVTYPDTYTFDETYRRGMDRLELPVVLMVGKVSDRASRDRLGRYVDGSGTVTAFDSVAGSVTAELAAAMFGAAGLRAELASSTQSYVGWTVAGATHYLRAYIRTPAENTINSRLMWTGIAASPTDGWDVRLVVGTDKIGFATRNTLRFSLGADGADAALLPDTVYRVEAKIATGPAGTAEVRLYDAAGELLDSDTFAGVVDPAAEIRYGIGNGANATQVWDLDAIGYSSLDWPGPMPASGELTNSFEGIGDGVAVTTANSGSASIKAVLEVGTYTAFDTVRVASAEFDIVSMAGVEHLAATFTVDITGQGA